MGTSKARRTSGDARPGPIGTWRKKSGSGIFHFKGQEFYERQKKLSFMLNRLKGSLRITLKYRAIEQENTH